MDSTEDGSIMQETGFGINTKWEKGENFLLDIQPLIASSISRNCSLNFDL